MPNQIEEIYSIRESKTYDILFEDIYDYIELFGHITFPVYQDDYSHLMFVDIDYKYDTVWENQVSSYVTDQILANIREKLIDTFFEEEKEQEIIGITGLDEIFIHETTYLYHKYKGGIWESSDTDIVDIDTDTGVIYGKSIGKVTITYVVDNGCGLLTCFKKLEVKY